MTTSEPHPRVDLSGLLTRQGTAAWEAVDELAAKSDIDHWALLGGMMVMIQSARFGLAPSRVTDDADVVVDIRTHGRRALLDLAQTLVTMGFDVHTSPEGITRYVRGDARIDLLAPERTGSLPVETSPPGRAVSAPGATQALARTEQLEIQWSPERVTSIRVPTVLGALIAKAAATNEIPSLARHERHKHLSDMVQLLEVAATHLDIDLMTTQLSKKDRARLRSATAKLANYPWTTRDQERVVMKFVNELRLG